MTRWPPPACGLIPGFHGSPWRLAPRRAHCLGASGRPPRWIPTCSTMLSAQWLPRSEEAQDIEWGLPLCTTRRPCEAATGHPLPAAFTWIAGSRKNSSWLKEGSTSGLDAAITAPKSSLRAGRFVGPGCRALQGKPQGVGQPVLLAREPIWPLSPREALSLWLGHRDL